MRNEKVNFQYKSKNNAWCHFITITHHKIVVMQGCFRVGLFKQGLLHDLSKYTWEEFKTGVQYYQGTRSPNAAEKEEKGYSSAWLHHKGRNKHHFEYWTDYNPAEKRVLPVKMPYVYLLEMFCDRLSASKVYQGKNYNTNHPFEYLNNSKDRIIIHKDTFRALENLLIMIRDKGEEYTFDYIKTNRKKLEEEYNRNNQQ